MSREAIPQKWELDDTLRYKRENMDRAMQGRIERALVELITNADDSYIDMKERGERPSGIVRIEIVRRRRGQAQIVRVRDQASGMSRLEMYDKLGALGRRTSGAEAGKPRRGLHGRGAKDAAVFGSVKFECIKNGEYNCLVIPKSLSCSFENAEPLVPSDAKRKELGILRGGGTSATVEVLPSYRVPHHDNLFSEFSRYYSLRDIFANPERSVTLVDCKNRQEDPLVYKFPKGRIVFDDDVDVDGYPGAKAHLRLELHPSRFVQESGPTREGVLIKSKVAIHDCTHFNLESQPEAWRFTGRLTCAYIDQLVNEYDDLEEISPEAVHPDSNPMPLLDPLRDGLMGGHPFAQNLFKACSRILKQQIEKLKALEDSDRKAVANEALKEKLGGLSREISDLLERKAKELEAETPGTGQKGHKDLPIGLHLIPPEASIIAGETKTFSVVVKHFEEVDESLPVVLTASDPEFIEVSGTSGRLSRSVEDPCVGRMTFSVKGLSLGSESFVEVKYNGYCEILAVKVVEPPRPTLQDGLSFEKARYRVRVNKEKELTLWLKAKRDADVRLEGTIRTDCPDLVLKRGGTFALRKTATAGVYTGNVRVEGRRLKARGFVEATIPGFPPATTAIRVEERETEAGPILSFDPVEEDYDPLRYKWDLADPNHLLLGARHPAIRRYLGAFVDGKYERVDSPLYHAVLAEVIAEALAFRLLPAHFKRDGQNEMLDSASTDTYFHRHFSDFLTVAHKWLVPNPENVTVGQ